MIANLLLGIAEVLNALITIYMIIVVVAALITWVQPDPYNPIVRFLRSVTEPVFYRVRRWLPFVYASGFDFSPVVVVLGLMFIKYVVVYSLFELAIQIRGGTAMRLR